MNPTSHEFRALADIALIFVGPSRAKCSYLSPSLILTTFFAALFLGKVWHRRLPFPISLFSSFHPDL